MDPRQLQLLFRLQWAILEQIGEIADTLGKDQNTIAKAVARIKADTASLRAAVQQASPIPGRMTMSAPTGVPTIDELVTDVTALDQVVVSAVALINGIAARIDAAVAAAIAGGATAAQLAPLTGLATDIKAKTTELANAVAANTPPARP